MAYVIPILLFFCLSQWVSIAQVPTDSTQEDVSLEEGDEEIVVRKLEEKEPRDGSAKCGKKCISHLQCGGGENGCQRCGWGGKCGGCFPGDSLVTTNGGETKKITNLRIGDIIMTVENGEMMPTKVLGFLEKMINQTAVYLEIILDNDRSLFISARHTMFIITNENRLRSVLAKDVSIGDLLILSTGKEVQFGRVQEVRMENKKGAYVPLTDIGTLLVDGVLVSSYANTNHWLAHIALTPLRWWPTWLLDDEKTQDLEGIRTYPHLVRKLGDVLGLVTMARKTENTDDSTKGMSILGIDGMDKTEFACNIDQ